jgi:hypothetical protein
MILVFCTIMERSELSAFKEQVRLAREHDEDAWERSRHLVRADVFPETAKQLWNAIQSATLAPIIQQSLLTCLADGRVARIQDLSAEPLKRLTGLPTTKAVRALCVLFGLTRRTSGRPISALPSSVIEEFVRHHSNPYDLLLEADVASLLDLGAGDLSFEQELVEHYASRLRLRKTPLTLHAVDRIRPGSQLGGPIHVPRARLQRLADLDPDLVQFHYWGNQDMFALERNPDIWPTYSIVTCHAPATPTFAFEPARLSQSVIATHLRRTKGDYRAVELEGEPALEVVTGGKALLFPPWKFDIRGPLALLDLLSRRGRLCVLTAIDTEVFWEILAQLIADPRVRPTDVVFTPQVIQEAFGQVHADLTALPVGQTVPLSDVTGMRQDLPRILERMEPTQPSYAFQTVLIRRGATFPDMPASLTARLFKDMKDEQPPWCLLLVP